MSIMSDLFRNSIGAVGGLRSYSVYSRLSWCHQCGYVDTSRRSSELSALSDDCRKCDSPDTDKFISFDLGTDVWIPLQELRLRKVRV